MENKNSGKKKKKEKGSLRPLSGVEFKKKASSLTKQIYELSTLCDVPACLILRTPDTETYGKVQKTYTWPENDGEFRRVVDLYKSKVGRGNERLEELSTDQAKNLLGVLDEKIEGLRVKIENAKVGTGGRTIGIGSWNDGGDVFNRLAELDAKIEALATKIDSVMAKGVISTTYAASPYTAQHHEPPYTSQHHEPAYTSPHHEPPYTAQPYTAPCTSQYHAPPYTAPHHEPPYTSQYSALPYIAAYHEPPYTVQCNVRPATVFDPYCLPPLPTVTYEDYLGPVPPLDRGELESVMGPGVDAFFDFDVDVSGIEDIV